MVVSRTSADAPGGVLKYRVKSWRLNKDFSIDVAGETVVASMYDLSIGNIPADVMPDAVPSKTWYAVETGGTLAAPEPLQSITATIDQAEGRYTLSSTWVLPSPIGTVAGTQRTAHFFDVATGGTAIAILPLNDLALDLATLTAVDGDYPADKSDTWVEIAGITINGDLAKSTPVFSNRLKINADTSNAGVDGDLRDIVFDTTYGDSANGWTGVGLLWKLSWRSGCIDLKARYEPPLDGIAPAVTTLLKYVKPWVETDVTPLVDGSSLIQGFNSIPYFGNPGGDSETRKGYIEVAEVPISEATIYLHGLGESLTGGQEFKRVRSATPPSSTRYLSLTLTPTQVGNSAEHPLAPITGASVTTEERETATGWEGRYVHTFTPPSADPWYKWTRIQGNWCDSSYTPATLFDNDQGFISVGSPVYSPWWEWPEADEYHQYRYRPEDINLTPYNDSAPVVNFHLVGRPKNIDAGKIDPTTLPKGAGLGWFGDFEGGLNGWSAGGSNPFTIVSGAEAYYGQSAKATGNGTDQSLVYDGYPVVPGKSYRVSIWCNNTTNGSNALFDIFTVGPSGLIFQNFTYVASGSGWHIESLDITAGATAQYLVTRASLAAAATSGAFWVDNVTIEEITPVAASGSVAITVTQPDGPDTKEGMSTYRLSATWTGFAATSQCAMLRFTFSASGTAEAPIGNDVTPAAAAWNVGPSPRPSANVSATIRVYAISQDGAQSAAALDTEAITITAGATGKLNLTTVDLTTVDGFRKNPTTGKFEPTQAGIMSRLALADYLGLDISGALKVTGIDVDWVLASLVAVTGAVVVSNTNASLTISAAGTITRATGGNSVTITSTSMTMSGGGSQITLDSGGIFTTGAVHGSGCDFSGTIEGQGLIVYAGGAAAVQIGGAGLTLSSAALANWKAALYGTLGNAAYYGVGTGLYDCAVGNHNHDSAYSAAGHNHDSAYAAKGVMTAGSAPIGADGSISWNADGQITSYTPPS
jgi:hypothetical protein